jgi:hypothetical protein
MCSKETILKYAEDNEFRNVNTGELYKMPPTVVPTVTQNVPQKKTDASWYRRLSGGPFNRSQVRSLFGD